MNIESERWEMKKKRKFPELNTIEIERKFNGESDSGFESGDEFYWLNHNIFTNLNFVILEKLEISKYYNFIHWNLKLF